MTTASIRRARHPCSIITAICVVLVTKGPPVFGFQVTVPASRTGCSISNRSSRISSRGTICPGRHGSSDCGTSRTHPKGFTYHRAQECVLTGFVVCQPGSGRSRRSGSALLSRFDSSADEGAEGRQQSPAEAQRAAEAAAGPASVTVAAARRYVGDSAGVGDEGGVGGPKGDGRGKEWTVDLCSKRLSLLHRKLRQVKSLQAQQSRDPDSLDDAQRVKLRRKQNLVTEISELEALRRNLRQEWDSGGGGDGGGGDSSAASKKVKKSRLPPGPFATSNAAAGAGSGQQQGLEEEAKDDGAQYTRDGLRLASPKRMVQSQKLASAGVADAAGPEAARNRRASPSQPLKDGDLFVDGTGAGLGADTEEGVSAMAAMLRAAMDERDEEGDDGEVGFDEQAGYASLAGDQKSQTMEAPAGGYPKRLAGIMSFCRVSDKATCEILVDMGRVTVNGVVATDPAAKVDLLTDIVVANGVAVTFPGKIDNSDETRRPREDIGKRTGPIPKAERNTWKRKTKYRWGMDDGLLAKRTRRATNAKSFEKKRRTGGVGVNDW